MRIRSFLTVCALIAACGGPADAPELALRQWLEAMETAAEDRDRHAMLDGISENYADARGNTRKDIGDTLLAYFLRQQKIAIVSTIDAIDLSGGSAATMAVTVAMAGDNSRGWGLSADAYRFELELENSGSGWLLIGARWGALGDDLR